MTLRLAKFWTAAVAGAALLNAPAAIAQFPSPTYQDLTILGTQHGAGGFAPSNTYDWTAFQRFNGGLNAYGPTININDKQYAGGAKGDGTTDDTAAVQAAINAAVSSGGTLVIPAASNCYKTTVALTITGNLNIVGVYLADNWAGGINAPLGSPPLAGSVICPTSSGADAIDISGVSTEVSIQNLGIRFLTPFTTTGDAINYVQADTTKQGLSGSVWSNVKVYGHDGNHYAFNLLNPISDTFTALQAHGGGGIKLYGSAPGDFGNLVFIQPYMDVATAGTGYGYRIESDSATLHHLNLITMIRPQCNVNNTGISASPPTSSQYIYFQDANTSAVTLIAPDLETNVGSSVQLGAAGVHNYVDWQGGFTDGATLNAPSWGAIGIMSGPNTQTFNDTTATGTIAEDAEFSMPGWHLTRTNAGTVSVVSTLRIAPPIAGTGVTGGRLAALYSSGEIFNTSDFGGTGGAFITGTINFNKSAAANVTEIGDGNTSGAVTIGNSANSTTLGSTSVTIPLIALDTGLTDATVCEDTTNHRLFAGSGTLGVCLGTSSLRYKRDWHLTPDGLTEIMALKPGNYFYKPGYGDSGKKEQYGFLAEDVIHVLPKLTGLDAQGRPNSVDLLGMVPVMVKAMQQQEAEIAELRGEIAALRSHRRASAR